MPGIKVRGIVIKENQYGESNKMLSIFTNELGIIKASMYGAKSIKNGKTALGQFLGYSELELADAKGGVYTVTSGNLLEGFFPIAEDIEKLSLAVYLSDLLYEAVGVENVDDAAFSLFLNTLYAICYKELDLKIAKAVFELRLMSISGYSPVLTKCIKCGNINNIVEFSGNEGGLLCKDCQGEGEKITKSVVDAMNYIISSDPKKIFSFKISDESKALLGEITEEYVKVQLDREFGSLQYFKKILI